MTVAEQVVAALRKLGVRRLFGLPGSTEAPLLDALADGAPLEYVLTLHENVAVAMADGYWRGGGGIGVANLHTTVGSANGLSQMYNAYRDGVPLVVLAGHKDTRLHNRDGFCTTENLPGMVRAGAKWSTQSMAADQVVADICRAVKIAFSDPWGPVFLSLPEDLMGAPAGADPLAETPAEAWLPRLSARPSREQLQQAAELLAQARRPVIIAGDEVARAGAQADLASLAERLGAVVLGEHRRSATSLNFPADHPSFAGHYERRHPAVAEADCLLAAGCKLVVEFSPSEQPDVPPGVPLIHIHRNPAEIAKLYPVRVGLVGDSGAAVRELLELLGPAEGDAQAAGLSERRAWVARQREAWLASLRREREEQAGRQPMRMSEAAYILAGVLPADAVLVDEAVRSSTPLTRHYPFRQPGSYQHTSGGALGWGLPAAIGVQMAQPQRRVVALVGDGSALFTIQALWTAARARVPAIFVILNNGVYLAVKAAIHQRGGAGAQTGNYPAAGLGEVDFVRVAEGFGVAGQRATNPESFREALRVALQGDAPYLIDLQIAEEPV